MSHPEGPAMKTKRNEQNPPLKAAYLEIVENQLRANDPPETRQTYERLRTEGISEKDAKTLIASVIAYETYEILHNGTAFNEGRFIRNLNRLPEQSFIDE
jgi:hypothetical protein